MRSSARCAIGQSARNAAHANLSQLTASRQAEYLCKPTAASGPALPAIKHNTGRTFGRMYYSCWIAPAACLHPTSRPAVSSGPSWRLWILSSAAGEDASDWSLSGAGFPAMALTFDYGAFQEALTIIDDKTIPFPARYGRALDEAVTHSKRASTELLVVVTTARSRKAGQNGQTSPSNTWVVVHDWRWQRGRRRKSNRQ